MQLVPGSHQRPVLEHRSVNDDPASQALQCTDSIDPSAVVTCPLPVGGCTNHHAGTLHCFGPNVSTMPRIAYIMTFGVPPKLAKGHRDFKGWKRGKPLPKEESVVGCAVAVSLLRHGAGCAAEIPSIGLLGQTFHPRSALWIVGGLTGRFQKCWSREEPTLSLKPVTLCQSIGRLQAPARTVKLGGSIQTGEPVGSASVPTR